MSINHLKTRAHAVASRLSRLTDKPLERACQEILQPIYPDLKSARRMTPGALQNKGVDLYLSGNDGYSLVVQCKGDEGHDFSENLHNRCIDAIKKFQENELDVEEYWLVTNLSPHRGQKEVWSSVNEAMKTLEKAKGCKARFLPAGRFAQHSLSLAIPVAISAFRYWALQRQNAFNQRFGNYHVDGVKAKVIRDKKSHIVDNISSAMLKDLSHSTNGAPAIHLLRATFGFGKTHTLLQLISALPGECIPIYVPLGLLTRKTFANATELARSVIELMGGQNEESEDSLVTFLEVFPEDFYDALLRQIILRDQNIVLLIDGLDEHRLGWTNAISELLGSLGKVKGHVVLACRDEYIIERQAVLSQVLQIPGLVGDTVSYLPTNQLIKPRSVYQLLDWERSQILDYLDQILIDQEDALEVIQLRERVADGQYEKFYGDIPKRPLFLALLVEALNEEKNTTSLVQIYRLGIRKKIWRDILGHTGKEFPDRAISDSEECVEILPNQIYHALILLGELPLAQTHDAAELDPNTRWEFSFDLFCRIVMNEPSQYMLTREALLRLSVIEPMWDENSNGNLMFQFSHQSFQDLFFAEFIAQSIPKEKYVSYFADSSKKVPNCLRYLSETGCVFLRELVALQVGEIAKRKSSC